ncbi:hypothetical protein ACJX0J_039841, partial [Zea mays]
FFFFADYYYNNFNQMQSTNHVDWHFHQLDTLSPTQKKQENSSKHDTAGQIQANEENTADQIIEQNLFQNAAAAAAAAEPGGEKCNNILTHFFHQQGFTETFFSGIAKSLYLEGLRGLYNLYRLRDNPFLLTLVSHIFERFF